MLKFFLPALIALVISCSPVKKYAELPNVRAWEKEIQRFEELDKTEVYPDNSVLFTGSSSIVLWSTLKDDMAPYNIIQRGYGGSRLSDFAVYADRIIYPHRYSGIVIFLANDITGSDADKSPEEVGRLFRFVLKTIRGKFPETPVFWIAITPTSSRWKVWPLIRKANNIISEICSRHKNTYFIPTEKYFLNDKGMPRDELFRPDLLHLNTEGYKVWTGIIKNELDKVLQN
jgi:lysophospholipase L1-like esterase